MVNADSFKRVFIVSGWLTILFFCCIFLLPMVLRNTINQKISGISALTSDRFLEWGQYPMKDNVKSYKDFNVFSYQGLQENNILNVISSNYTYEYNMQYKNLTYLPNTDESIGFLNLFSHQSSFDENIMINDQITQVNLGLLHGYYEETNKPLEQRLAQKLFSIVKTIREDFIPKYFAHSLFYFYISNQNLTYQSILRKSDILNQTQADLIWNDADYGWKTWNGLAFWIPIILSGKYNQHPNWQYLKTHFSLQENQMEKLVGANSLVNDLIFVIQGAISDKNSCAQPACSLEELVALQWSSNSLMKYPVLDGVPVENSTSVQFYNNTLPYPPEISSIYNPKVPQTISGTQAQNLLSYMDDGNISPSTKTLLNYQNIKYVLDHWDAPDFVRAYFGFNTNQEALYIQNYLDYLNKNFIQRTSEVSSADPESTAISFLGSKALNTAFTQIQDTLLVQMNTKAVLKSIEDSKQTCQDLLSEIKANESQIICSNQNFSLNTEAAIEPWSKMVLFGRSSDSWSTFLNQTKIPESTLSFLIEGTSKLSTLFSNINSQISAFYKCKKSTLCDKNELAVIQWGTGYVTKNLPTPLFKESDRVESINAWSSTMSKTGQIPEFSALMTKQYKKPINISDPNAKIWLGYNQGGILNQYELELFQYYLAVDDRNHLKQRFQIDSDTATLLSKYINRLIIDYIFQGTFIETNAYSLIWNQPDTYKTYFANIPNLEGGTPAFDTTITFKTKDNLADWKAASSSLMNVINTGLKHNENVRAMKSYQGSRLVTNRIKCYNGKTPNSIYYTLSNPWKMNITITGTDGNGFISNLDDSNKENLKVFNPNFGRILTLKVAETVNDNDYEYYRFKFSQDNFAINDNLTTRFSGTINMTTLLRNPVIVTLPYFKSSDSALYKNILLNGSSFDSFNYSHASGSYLVEKYTGYTVQKKIGFQYSAYVGDIKLLDDSYDLKKNQAYPLFMETEYMQYNNQRSDALFRDIYDTVTIKNRCFWACLALSIFFFLLTIGSGFFYIKKRSQRKQGLLSDD